MKAKIINLVDLKKTVAELEAEQLLAQLTSDKAIQITLETPETPRKINRIFRKAAQAMGKTITARPKEGQIIIRLKEPTATKT